MTEFEAQSLPVLAMVRDNHIGNPIRRNEHGDAVVGSSIGCAREDVELEVAWEGVVLKGLGKVDFVLLRRVADWLLVVLRFDSGLGRNCGSGDADNVEPPAVLLVHCLCKGGQRRGHFGGKCRCLGWE